jgi:hypothetical protein
MHPMSERVLAPLVRFSLGYCKFLNLLYYLFMEKWPPALPENDAYMTAFAHVLLSAKNALLREPLSDADLRIVKTMNDVNTSIRLAVSEDPATNDQLVVCLEVQKKVRKGACRVLKPAPDEDDIHMLPMSIAHGAINTLDAAGAVVIADTVVADFFEQYRFACARAKDEGISRRELRSISPKRRAAELRKIHRQICERIVPIDALDGDER